MPIIKDTILNTYPFYDNSKNEYIEKGYNKIIFNPGVPVQQRELTAIGNFSEEKIKDLTKSIHGDNRIVKGIHIKNISKENTITNITFSNGTVILNGLVYNIPEFTVESTITNNTTNIYIVLDEQLIAPKSNDDPYTYDDYKDDNMGNQYLINDKELLDPTIEDDNYLNPGAFRIKRWACYLIDPNFDDYPYHIYIASISNGDLIQLASGITAENSSILPVDIIFEETENDINNNYISLMENRTFEESGNYIVKGLKVYDGVECFDNSKYGIKISRGTAYIEGRRVEVPDTYYYISKKSGTTKTITELHRTDDKGKLRLNNSNITNISNVKASQMVSHVAFVRDPFNEDIDLFSDYLYEDGQLPPCLADDIKIHNTNYDNRKEPPKRPKYRYGIDYILENTTTIRWLNKENSIRPARGETFWIWYNGLLDVPNNSYLINYGYEIEHKTIKKAPGIITIPEDNYNQNIYILSIMDQDGIIYIKDKNYSIHNNTILFPHIYDEFPINITLTKSSVDVDYLPYPDVITSIPLIRYYSRNKCIIYHENIHYSVVADRIEWYDVTNMPAEGDTFVASTYIIPSKSNIVLDIEYITEPLERASNINQVYSAYVDFSVPLPKNAHVEITYSYVTPKYDRIYINKNGNISNMTSFNDGLYSYTYSNKIDLADIAVKYLAYKPIIKLSNKYNVKMSDLRTLTENVRDLQYNIALTRLEKRAEELAGTYVNLRGIFTDSFENYNKYDMIYVEKYLDKNYPYHVAIPNALTNKLELNEYKITGLLDIDFNYSSNIKKSNKGFITINNNYKPVLWKKQAYANDAKSISKNSDIVLNLNDPTTFKDLFLDTPTLEMDPNTDYFIDGDVIFNQIFEYTLTKIISQSLNYNETLARYGIKTINKPEKYTMSKVYTDDNSRSYEWQIIDSTLYEWDGMNLNMITEYIDDYINDIHNSLYLRPIVITIKCEGYRPFQEKIELTFDGKFCPLTPFFPDPNYDSHLVMEGWKDGSPVDVYAHAGWEADIPGNGLMKADADGRFWAQFVIPKNTTYGSKEIIISAPGAKTVFSNFNATGFTADIEHLLDETNLSELIKSKYSNYKVNFDGYKPNINYNGSRVDNWDICPISQTFYVNKQGYRGGSDILELSETPDNNQILPDSDVWVTKVEVYFKNPGEFSDIEVNSWFTPTDNYGYPNFSDSSIYMKPLKVGTIKTNVDPITILPLYSNDSSKPCPIYPDTDHPIKLDGSKLYSFNIGSYDKSVEVFCAKTSENDILTSNIIPSNADKGLLLASDRTKKWEVFLDEDLKYNIWIADFSEGFTDDNIEMIDGVKYYKNVVYFEPLIVNEFSINNNHTSNIPHFTYCNNCILTIDDWNNTLDSSVFVRYELSVDTTPDYNVKEWIKFESGQINEFLNAVGTIWVRAILYTKNKYNTPIISSKITATILRYVPRGVYVSNTINLSNQINEIELYLDRYVSPENNNILDITYSTDEGLIWRLPKLDNIIPIVIDPLRKEVVYQNKYKNLLYIIKPSITSIVVNSGNIISTNYSLNNQEGNIDTIKWYKVSLTDIRGFETPLSDPMEYKPLGINGYAEIKFRIDPHATGYKVYRSDTKDGVYTLIYDSSLVTTIIDDMDINTSEVRVKDINFVKKLPDVGRLRIDDELVFYSSKDISTGTIHGISRGYNNTTKTKHYKTTMIEFLSESEENINDYTKIVGGAGKMPLFLYDTIGEYPEIIFYDYGIADTGIEYDTNNIDNEPFYTSDNIKLKIEMMVLDRDIVKTLGNRILIDSGDPSMDNGLTYDSGTINAYNGIIIDSLAPYMSKTELELMAVSNRNNIPEASRLMLLTRYNEIGIKTERI